MYWHGRIGHGVGTNDADAGGAVGCSRVLRSCRSVKHRRTDRAVAGDIAHRETDERVWIRGARISRALNEYAGILGELDRLIRRRRFIESAHATAPIPRLAPEVAGLTKLAGVRRRFLRW